MLCRKLHCQKGFSLISFSYEIVRRGHVLAVGRVEGVDAQLEDRKVTHLIRLQPAQHKLTAVQCLGAKKSETTCSSQYGKNVSEGFYLTECIH